MSSPSRHTAVGSSEVSRAAVPCWARSRARWTMSASRTARILGQCGATATSQYPSTASATASRNARGAGASSARRGGSARPAYAVRTSDRAFSGGVSRTRRSSSRTSGSGEAGRGVMKSGIQPVSSTAGSARSAVSRPSAAAGAARARRTHGRCGAYWSARRSAHRLVAVSSSGEQAKRMSARSSTPSR
ncbi:hypothetical protein [Streptomyces sp. cg36]|uniref:hypothetical protein n=1 Tax=Streptomyces sp. cg36 TaxID=3238798 RepID=UPI0034E1D4A0